MHDHLAAGSHKPGMHEDLAERGLKLAISTVAHPADQLAAVAIGHRRAGSAPCLQRASCAAITTISKPFRRRKRAADIARSAGNRCNLVVLLRHYLEILCYNKWEHFTLVVGLTGCE